MDFAHKERWRRPHACGLKADLWLLSAAEPLCSEPKSVTNNVRALPHPAPGLVQPRFPPTTRLYRSCPSLRERVDRQFSPAIAGQPTRRKDRQNSQSCHDEQPDLQSAQARLGIDAHRLRHLLRRRIGAGKNGLQPVVADEVDIVEVYLRLQFGREFRARGNSRNQRQQRCPPCFLAPARSHQKRLAEHDAHNDENCRTRLKGISAAPAPPTPARTP